MKSPIEFHSQSPDNGFAGPMRLRLCWIYSPGRCFSTGRGFLLHELIIRDRLSYSQVVLALDIPDPVTYNRIVAKKLPPEFRAYLSKIGKQGGLKGGPARAEKLSAEERRESARKAVQARWAKAKAGTSA